MSKKWSDPLDRLLDADRKANSVNDYLQTHSNVDNATSLEGENVIIDMDVNEIIRWEHKDRPENELYDIDGLAETFKKVGQQQPCTVRKSKKQSNKYELIIGERRWRAAKQAGVKLKVIIKDIDDRQASLIEAIENESREDISEYAKGMSYANKIDKGILTQKDLIKELKLSKQQVSRLLSFKKIPSTLFEAIEDFRLVSARTSEELCRLSAKSDKHLEALISMAPKIRTGKFGEKRIIKELNNILSHEKQTIQGNKKIRDNNGRHLFTWRLDNNAVPSIHFPQDIIKLINDGAINFGQLSDEFKECLSRKLSEL
jgi:ParB family chromosome partitioning protein